jgi:hypothetical protein
MGISIFKETEFLEKVIMETIGSKTETKVEFPLDLMKKIEGFSVKPVYPVQNDKIY